MALNRFRPRILTAGVAATALTVIATSCGGDAAGGSADQLTIVTSFYPLQYISERVAGEHGTVDNLTQPGAEPHDLELTPKDVGSVGDADLVVYLSQFQPSVDDAVEQQATDHSYDVAKAAKLAEPNDGDHEEHDHGGEAGHEGHDHSDHEGHDHGDNGHEGHDHGSSDPHFWLDPTRLAAVTDAVAGQLAKADPDHAADYRANAKAVSSDLTKLDRQFRNGLDNCASDRLVTSHEAFGYLAERYGLTQEGISGLDPSQEPPNAKLAELSSFVEDHNVSTIYYETLVDPSVAKTLAQETGAKTAVLDPLEGLTDDANDADYLSVMKSNLRNLRQGQGCE